MSHENRNTQNQLFTQQFIDATGSVTTYNHQYTGGESASRNIFDAITGNKEDETTKPKVTFQEEAAMAKEVVQFLQADELAAMGITLFDSNKPGGMEEVDAESLQEGSGRPSTLIMLITDADKFGQTVSRLDPTPEQKDKVRHSINGLLESSQEFIRSMYKPTDQSEGEPRRPEYVELADQQLEMFESLNPGLTEKGFGDLPTCESLREYVVRKNQGTITDYIEAELLGYVSGWGPAYWTRDTSPERFSAGWSKAFKYLQSLRDRQSPLFSELFTKLRADFDTSKEWLTGDEFDEQRSGYNTDYVSSLLFITADISRTWEEAFPLENSLYLSDRS